MVIDPSSRTATILGERVAPWPFVDRYEVRAGNQLTPQVVYECLALADLGYLYRQADLFDEIRETDAHLHAVLSKLETAISGADWELEAPEESGAAGETIATWCDATLRNMEPSQDFGMSFAELLTWMQGGIYHGRAVAEVIWDEQGKEPRSIEMVHPRRLAMASDWRLHLWDQAGTMTDIYGSDPTGPTGTFPGLPLAAFPPGKFIVHTPKVRGVYPQREGVGRACVWYSCFKKWGIRDLMALAQWAGRGMRIGTYASGKRDEKGNERDPATPEDVTALRQALEAATSSVSLVIPDTTGMEIVKSDDEPKVHEAIVRLCNSEMSKAVLGSTLTTEVGITGGNRALGEVHQDSETQAASRWAKSIATTLRRDLIRPMVERKFGKGAPVPAIRFATDPEQDLDAAALRVEKAVKSGVKLGQRTTRNYLQLPDPEDDEEIIGGEPVSKPGTAAPPSAGPATISNGG